MCAELRPIKNEEVMYSYVQTLQIAGQTGCIGYLSVGFDGSSNNPETKWYDQRGYLKTDEFDSDFERVKNDMKNNYGCGCILRGKNYMTAFCMTHPESKTENSECDEYVFRTDTEKYSYIVRIQPFGITCWAYIYCYRLDWLDEHIKNSKEGIRFIYPDYRNKFTISDGSKIIIKDLKNGMSRTEVCRFVDSYHLYVGNTLYHICEFAEKLEADECEVEPVKNMCIKDVFYTQ